MKQFTEESLLAVIGKDDQPKLSEKGIMFEAARLSIVSMLLKSSYYELGIAMPSDVTLAVRAQQISNKFDCGNALLKSRFEKAIEIKGIKDVRTPITVGDLVNADRMLSSEEHPSCYRNGMKLPSLDDKDMWTEEMVKYAVKYEQKDLALLSR